MTIHWRLGPDPGVSPETPPSAAYTQRSAPQRTRWECPSSWKKNALKSGLAFQSVRLKNEGLRTDFLGGGTLTDLRHQSMTCGKRRIRDEAHPYRKLEGNHYGEKGE